MIFDIAYKWCNHKDAENYFVINLATMLLTIVGVVFFLFNFNNPPLLFSVELFLALMVVVLPMFGKKKYIKSKLNQEINGSMSVPIELLKIIFDHPEIVSGAKHEISVIAREMPINFSQLLLIDYKYSVRVVFNASP